MFDLEQPLLYTGWYQVWQGRLESLNADGMFAQSGVAMGVGVMQSTINQDMAGIGWFVKEQFQERVRIGYCSGTQMYTNL